jgi:hypothetical protein
MTIHELASLIYEDLNGLITSARGTERGFEVVYECDHWRDHDSRVAFLLRCSGVAESTVTPRASDDLHWTDDHPVLHDHNSEHGILYFSSRPANPHEIVGRLYQAHETFYGGWREFREYVNTCGDTITILGNGSGVLAEGPLSLLREFEGALAGLLATNIVETPRRFGDYGNYKALLFDESFVVCRECEVEPWPNEAFHPTGGTGAATAGG